MPAVRVRDALRYASKFVGLLLAVAVVAGGFVAGGAYLAAEDLSFTDPSLSALSETPVFIGVVLLAIGVILALIGLVALGHKFLADGVAAAAAAREIGQSTAAGTADEDEVSDADAETGTGGSASAGAAATTASSAAETKAEGGSGSDDEGSVDSPAETPPTTEPVEGPVGAPGASSERDATAEADQVAGGSTEGQATSTEPDANDGSAAETGGEDGRPEEPPEWTPPDPSEFEAAGPNADDGDGGRPAESTGGDAGTETDPEEIPDDATLADEGVDSFSTASEDDPLSDRLPGDDEN